MEINPRDSQLRNHRSIADFKADNCLGLDTDGSNFFVIDEEKSVHFFKRKNNYRDLEFRGELSIKEFSRQDVVKIDFKKCIITENYLIYGSKLFYLYKDEPYPDGIMDTEELLEEDNDEDEQIEEIKMIRGPIKF